jgi:hypothetical protein
MLVLVLLAAVFAAAAVVVNASELLLDLDLVERLKGHRDAPVNSSSAVIPFPYPLFSQCDPAWGNDLMDTKTICQVGCLMSSTAMAIAGSKIAIPPNAVSSNSGTLNAWLKANGGYDGSNDLIESVVQKIDPARIVWPSDAMHTTNDLPYSTIKSYLSQGRVVVANVNGGHHFVLTVGFSDDGDTLTVNDPGYDKSTYSYSKDVVGWRIYDMVRE